MNKDYTYCVGFGIDAIPVTLCKNCRRLFPFASLHRKMIFGGRLYNTTRTPANALYTNQKQTTTNKQKLWQNLTK